MVQVSRGALIETDVPTKVLILFFNEQCTPDKKFVIQDLDETRLFVQDSALPKIEQQLREYHNKNTFIAPAKDGQSAHGGCSVRMGLAGEEKPSTVFPNCMAKGKGDRQWTIGDMLLDTRHISGLSVKRPVDRGYVTNLDTQQEIWSRALDKVMKVDPRERSLLLTEAPMNLDACRGAVEELVFEGLGFQGLHTATPAELALRHVNESQPGVMPLPRQAAAGVVLDCGFSFTHAVPVFDGQVVAAGVRRLNLGGKAITNLLKETVSYRSLNMMDEAYLMELIKDSVSFVSQDTVADLTTAKQKRSALHLEYVLPDGVHNLRGFSRTPKERARGRGGDGAAAEEQTLMLGNERFMPMESLFRPLDIGLRQAGAAELVAQAVAGCPPQIEQLLFENVVVVGGAAKCPGFKERLQAELRPLVPNDLHMEVHVPEEPDLAAWRGGSRFAASPEFLQVVLTKAEYEEHGGSAARRMAEA